MRRTDIKYFFTLCIILIVASAPINAQNIASNYSEVNESTTHSAIVEAGGYAYLAEDKTISQIREKALANAKREALEKAQVYLQSFTKVENSQVSYDLIKSQAQGFVKILESKDLGITPDNRYHYWIKAEIEYQLKMPDEQKSPELSSSQSAPLTVRIWTEKLMYHQGEGIIIFLRGNKNFYARVLYVNAQNEIFQLLPNQHRTDNYFKGGTVITIPDVMDGFKFIVKPPFGKEKIIVYASSEPLGKVETAPMGEAIFSIKSDLTMAGQKTRRIISGSRDNSKVAEFCEASCVIETKLP